MLTFNYTANNPATNSKVSAVVEAEDAAAAAALIRKEGLTPIDIKEAGTSSNLLSALNRVSTKDRILFSRMLSTLLNAGLPLVQALRSSGDQTTSKPLKAVINSIVSDIEGGKSFSVALQRHPKVFNNIYINLVAAGEASGTLDKALERLATQQEKDADLISKIRGALAYPVIVLLVMGVVVGFMIVKVLPSVGSLYNSLPGVQLPIETRLLLSLSHFIIHFWYIVSILVIVAAVLGRLWSKTVTGRKTIDELKMKIWPFGPLFMKMYMARFAQQPQPW